MNFAEAFAHMLAGRRIRRREWGRVLYVEYDHAVFRNKNVPVIQIAMTNNKVSCYTPAQCDMLGDDWELVP